MWLVRWFFRHATGAGPQCGHCGTTLITCPRCLGAWHGRACDCGVGLLCGVCGRHWA